MYEDDYLNNDYKLPELWFEKYQNPVIRISDCEEKLYDSIEIASKENNVPCCDIKRVMDGKRKTARGYKWKCCLEESSINQKTSA